MRASDVERAPVFGLLLGQLLGITDIKILQTAVFSLAERDHLVGDGDRIIGRSRDLESHINHRQTISRERETLAYMGIIIIDSTGLVRTVNYCIESSFIGVFNQIGDRQIVVVVIRYGLDNVHQPI